LLNIPALAGPHAPVAAEQAAANLRHDSQAAASATLSNGRATPVEHALQQAETRVSEEGVNLLKDKP
jgi:hypothetical protein